MDKLEKAMEKARQQRRLHTPSYGNERPDVTAGIAYTASTMNNDSVAIPDDQMDRSRLVAHRTRDQAADVFRLLRTQVLQIMNREGFKSLAITSPNYGDGKTTTALNLALSITLDLKQTVLLVDLDLRKPNLHQFLGFEPKCGLGDHLLKDTPIPDCLIRTSFERLSVLPAGQPIEQSSEVIGLPKMTALAHELKTRYPDRLIIYDMPPVLAQDDPLAFIPNVDCVLMVVREGSTKTQDVTRSLEILSGAKVIGTVLNDGML